MHVVICHTMCLGPNMWKIGSNFEKKKKPIRILWHLHDFALTSVIRKLGGTVTYFERKLIVRRNLNYK